MLARLWERELNAAHRERMQAAARELRDSTVPKVQIAFVQHIHA